MVRNLFKFKPKPDLSVAPKTSEPLYVSPDTGIDENHRLTINWKEDRPVPAEFEGREYELVSGEHSTNLFAARINLMAGKGFAPLGGPFVYQVALFILMHYEPKKR